MERSFNRIASRQHTSSAAKYRLLRLRAARNLDSDGVLVWWTTCGRYTASTGACQSSNPSGKYSYSRSALSIELGRDEVSDGAAGWYDGCRLAVVVPRMGKDADADRLVCGREKLREVFCIFAGGAESASGLGFF